MIFTSDNGGKHYSNMAGLAGGKGELWEGGIRVPAFARWPGVIPPGVVTRQVATTLDWTATMLAAGGASDNVSQAPDGIDLLPLFAGGTPRDREIFWRMGRARQLAVRNGGWKYLRDKEKDYLFDLVLDPGERNNLKDEQPETFRRLKASVEAWDREMLPPA